MSRKEKKLRFKLYETLEKQRNTILSIKNLTVSRSKHKMINPIIEGVNLEIFEGEVVGIIGESGSGKSTLLKAILNEQELQVTGQVKMLGANMFVDRSAIAHKFGFVPQSLEYLYENMSAMENLKIFGRQYGIEDKVIEDKSEALMENLDIRKKVRYDLPVKSMSGGERRRVSMACGLIHQPSILIMDEPTTGLDPILRYEHFWKYIEKINDIYKTTILIITHFPEESKFFDKIAIFVKGKGFIEYGVPIEILQRLPNQGFVVDLVLKEFDDKALSILKKVRNVKYVLMQGERFRVFAETPSKETVLNIVSILTKNGFKIFKIEAKREATMTDYFKILSSKEFDGRYIFPDEPEELVETEMDMIDIVLKTYKESLLEDLSTIKGIHNILVQREIVKILVKDNIKDVALDVSLKLTSCGYDIHKIDIKENPKKKEVKTEGNDLYGIRY